MNAKLVMAAAAIAILPTAASAAVFQNGSFETGSYSGNEGSFPNGSAAITGWTVAVVPANGTGNVQWQRNGNPDGLTASDGVYSLDLTGSNDASYNGMTQTFDVFSGHDYSVSFDVGADSRYTSAGGATVRALINGVTIATVNNPGGGSGTNWLTGTGLFSTGNASSVMLGLFGVAGGNFTGLDNVRVIDLGRTAATGAVPEPATWGLMILGFGGMGMSLRRRANRRPTAALA